MAKVVKPKAKTVAAKVKTAKTTRNPLLGSTWKSKRDGYGTWSVNFYDSQKLLFMFHDLNGKLLTSSRYSYTYKDGKVYWTDRSGKAVVSVIKGNKFDSNNGTYIKS